MQLADLIHHTMDPEISKLAGSPFLEYIDKHNVDHSFDKNVRSVRADIGYFLHPPCVIVVFYNSEFKFERIREVKSLGRWLVL